MLLPKNMSKEKTLESHIIYLFPRECLHFSGERLLTEEKQVVYFFFLNWTIVDVRSSLVAQMVKCLPEMWETRVWSLGWADPLEKEMATTSVLPGKFHGWRNLVDYCPWDHKELDTTERLYFTVDVQYYMLQV